MAIRALPDVAYLRECLDYDPATGEFRWCVRPQSHFHDPLRCRMWNGRYAGKLAGWFNPFGHHMIAFGRLATMSHRIAWAMTYGEPVPGEIDHIDGNPGNNCITNLRAATRADNQANKGPRPDSRLGVKGVALRKSGRFAAYIRRHDKRYWIGTFDTIEEAAAAHRDAAERLHGKFARHS